MTITQPTSQTAPQTAEVSKTSAVLTPTPLDLLLTHFDQLITCPADIPRLNELILQLAVQGKLVPQDPNDEPASALLERISAEKARLVAENKIRKSKPLPPIGADEIPFDLPEGWEWVRLDNISDIGTGSTPLKSNGHYYEDGTVPWVSSSATSDLFVSKASKYITKLAVKETRLRIYPKHTLIVALYGQGKTRGQISELLIEATINQALTAIVLEDLEPSIRSYIKLFFLKNYRDLRSLAEGGAQPNLNVGKVKSLAIPLPPLAEQKRIVAKVESLLAQTRALETQLAQAQQERVKLNKSALHHLLGVGQTRPKTSEVFETSEVSPTAPWQLIANNFDLLYNDPAAVDDLKQTILQLAVQGKLVPQDPADEPASVLLERIAAEKARLVKESKVKKPKPLPSIVEDEIPYETPKGWIWVRLGELSKTITKGSSPKWQGVQYVEKDEGILFITSKNVGQYELIRDEESYVESKFNEVEPRSILQKNDILMNIVGASIGRTAIYKLGEIANINQAVCLIRLVSHQHLSTEYLLHFFNSATCIGYMFNKQVDNARANLSMGNISKFPIPLPPLAEQKRIVAKVESLLGLCDSLQSQLVQGEAERSRLLASMLAGVVKGT